MRGVSSLGAAAHLDQEPAPALDFVAADLGDDRRAAPAAEHPRREPRRDLERQVPDHVAAPRVDPDGGHAGSWRVGDENELIADSEPAHDLGARGEDRPEHRRMKESAVRWGEYHANLLVAAARAAPDIPDRNPARRQRPSLPEPVGAVPDTLPLVLPIRNHRQSRTGRSLPAVALALMTGVLAPVPGAAQAPPRPSDVLGFEVGADRTLADWGQITGYFARLAASSASVTLDTLGATTNGQPMIMAVISSPRNIARLPEIRAAQARLADPRTLLPDEERRLLETQPSVILIQGNIHGSEIAASQMAMTLAYRLATNDTLQRALEQTVVLLIPSANPDGEQIITDWYRRGLGTAWEGGPVPWLYHPYVGHDNNRDWFMITQRETRLVTDVLYRQWFPEILYDVHQMYADGARLFVPPFVDPINPNVDPLIVRAIGHIGAEMALALQARGKRGVADGVIYDLWWHGGARSTPTRHNIVGVLTEAASVKIATPIVQTPADLKGHERGLPRYERRMNFPDPWLGGTWRLGDIVEYELIASEALVRMA